MEAWFDRFPGRLEWELEQFVGRGLRFALDEDELRANGRILLRGAIGHADRRLELEVLYPDLFPYLRPEVFASGLELERHQNPFERNLCLLDRSTREWNPSESGAWLVAERVPKLLDLIAAGGEELKRGEIAQGEPISAYFPPEPGTVVFVPTEALQVDPAARAGSGRLSFSPRIPPAIHIRALLSELAVQGHGRKPRVAARAADSLRAKFAGPTVPMRWVRVERPPLDRSPQALLEAAEALKPGFGSPPWHSVAGGQIAVTGVVFREEVAQGRWEDAWLFAVKLRQEGPPGVREAAYVTRGERLTPSDLASRLPPRARLDQATLAIIGTGALGAPIALECARAQAAELRLLDHDQVEVGNTVRWPYGLSTVAHHKVDVLSDYIDVDFAFTSVTVARQQIGASALARSHRTESEFDALARLLDGTDLVVDASAEIGIQQLISELADERGLAQIFVTATEGARGGVVARVIPEQTGCWFCLQLGIDDGTIPAPARDEAATVQPRGCSSRTFTGANFDLLPIVSQALRAITATVNFDDGQSRGPDVFVCSLPDDGLGAPTWVQGRIEPHARCPRCSAS